MLREEWSTLLGVSGYLTCEPLVKPQRRDVRAPTKSLVAQVEWKGKNKEVFPSASSEDVLWFWPLVLDIQASGADGTAFRHRPFSFPVQT